MEPAETEFSPAWWGPELPGLRPRVGTYGQYPYEHLPAPAGITFDGTLTWLRKEPIPEDNIVDGHEDELADNFNKLSEFSLRKSVPLPACFTNLFRDLTLPQKIRSCTACFLDLAKDAIPSPKGSGLIVRFLSDQQGCVFWYLYLNSGATDSCVVASTDYFGSDAEEAGFDPGNPESLVYAAPRLRRLFG